MTATVKKMNSLLAMAQHFRPDDVERAINSLNTAWIRAKKDGEPLGNFARGREDLSEYENDFALDWFNADKANPSVQTPNAPPPNNELKEEIAKLKNEKSALTSEKSTLINAFNAEKKAKETAEETVKILTSEADKLTVKIEGLERTLKMAENANQSGLSIQSTSTNDQIGYLRKELERVQKELATAKEGELKRLEAKEATHKGELETQKKEHLNDLSKRDETQVDAALAYQNQLAANDTSWLAKIQEADKRTAEKEAEMEKLKKAHVAELQPLLYLKAKRKYRELVIDWLPKSLYDVVNITSNLFALAGFILLFKWVGILAFIITACTFYAIVQDAKKTAGGWLTFFGVVGAFIIEAYYSYSHLNLFQKLLEGEKYPFGISSDAIGLAFTILISGGSVYAVIMTALRGIAAAEAQRVADIDAQLLQKPSNA